MLVPAIILCLVSSAFACETYSNAAAYFKTSNKNLRDALSWKEPSESQANFAVLLMTMVNIGSAIKDGASYDEAYAKYPAFIAAAEKSPADTRDQLLTTTDEVEKDSLSFRNLVDKTCGSDVSADCDCKVEESIKDDAKLQAQAALIVDFAISNWGGFNDAWQKAADNNAVSDYFAANKDALKDRTQAEAFKQLAYIEANGYSG